MTMVVVASARLRRYPEAEKQSSWRWKNSTPGSMHGKGNQWLEKLSFFLEWQLQGGAP